jgi:hypothetical protein
MSNTSFYPQVVSLICTAFVVVLTMPLLLCLISIILHLPIIPCFFVGVYIGFILQLFCFLKTKNFIKKIMLTALFFNFCFASITLGLYYQLYRVESL